MVIALLLALVAMSAVAHLAALHRDLPLQDGDEEFFVPPAIHMVASGNLDPHWFGHPGSTVIYPTAFAIRAWNIVRHDGPVFGPDRAFEARMERSPTTAYLIARLWVILLSVATIPLVFLLGRRVFGLRVALIATVIWSVLPLPVHFGRIVRTESAATFFGLLTLWCCVRLLDAPGSRRWSVIAGASAGLAVSSRYFMVTLVPCVIAAAVIGVHRDRTRAIRLALVATTSAFAAFVVTTPYFFLDWSTATRTLGLENHPDVRDLGLLGNLRWYAGRAIPATLTWPLFVLTIAGIALALWRRPRVRQLLLVAACAIYFAGVVASKQHWQRYVIEAAPVLVLFAALCIETVGTRLTRSLHRGGLFRNVVTVVLVGALVAVPIRDLIRVTRHDQQGTQRADARNWILQNVPAGSRVLQEPKLFNVLPQSLPPIGNGIRVDPVLDPEGHTLAEYRRQGYSYVVVTAGAVTSNLLSSQDARVKQFYSDLGCRTRLVAYFPRLRDQLPSNLHLPTG